MRHLTALVLAVAAFVLCSCGEGEDAKLLPGTTAAEITENLESVRQLADEEECIGAANAAENVATQVEALEGVDPKLKQALQRGSERLSEVVTTCEEETTEAIAPEEEATSEETTKPPAGEEKKEEKDREKEEAKLEKEAEKQEKQEPPAVETTPEETATPPPVSEDGGSGASGGVSPGAAVEPGGE